MTPHRFDPLSFVLGVVAVGVGILVMVAAFDDDRTSAGVWFALAALVLGVGLIPWSRRDRTRSSEEPTPG